MAKTEHAFKVGERVVYTGSLVGQSDGKKCVIRQLVPHLGVDLQYRIRDETEPYDRVVIESLLHSDVAKPG